MPRSAAKRPEQFSVPRLDAGPDPRTNAVDLRRHRLQGIQLAQHLVTRVDHAVGLEFRVHQGVGFDVAESDATVLAAELGYSRLRSDGYAEPLTASNPFNAAVSSGTDKLAIAKIEGKWTHVFSPKIDVTLRLAGAHGFAASSGLTATVAGFGTFEARDPEAASWAEYGLRGGYRLSDSLKLDVFANGLAGQGSIHSEAHVGAELTFKL